MSSVSEVMNKVKTLKNSKSYPLVSKNKGITTGALIGMAGGFLLAITRGKNFLTWGLLGAAAGGGLAAIYLSISKNEDDEPND